MIVSSRCDMGEKYDVMYRASGEKSFDRPRNSGWPRDRFQAIVAMGGEGKAVLDVGCGNGYLLYQFRNSFSRLIGLESSAERLSRAQTNLSGHGFVPILGSAEDMHEIDSDSVDLIISADTIEHVPDVYRAINEMYRVLAPGGMLVINTPNIAFIKKRLLLCLGRFPATSQRNEGVGDNLLFDGGHLHYFTFRSLGLVLRNAGFQLVRKMGYGPFGVLHNIFPSLLSGGVQWVARKP